MILLVRPGLRVSLTGSAYDNNERGRALTTAGVSTIDVDDMSLAGGVIAQWQAGTRTSVEARVYGTRFDESTSASPDTLYESLSKADATVSQAIGERHLLQIGIEASSNKYAGHNRVRNEEDGHAADTAVFWAQDRVNVGSRVTLTVGGRYDRHSIFGFAFSPKAAVHARLTDAVRLRASFGEGFRAPDLGQLFYRFVPAANVYQVIGNPNLGPESSRSWQAGADLTPWARTRVGINAFRNDVDNLIEAVSLPQPDSLYIGRTQSVEGQVD